MIFLKKSEIVYNYICDKITTDYLLKRLQEEANFGVDASEIQEKFNIVRNNASTILNDLLKEEKLIKINSRPVTFIPKSILNKLKINNTSRVFSPEEFKTLVEKNNKKSDIDDPFKVLIGFNNSLIHQIEQAKAAVMYPPHGLHTLILGESGVGKTTFASAVYKYVLLNKNTNSDNFPFISFNCSDYYNAPQLLLSQLFGHTKGAFTGADSDKIGIVEKAHNGILFLDEVHRLPPDGQEMLFYLMDKGEFSRLGETSKPRKSNVLIIAATTEDPNDTFLNTFLRRIPVTITLPSFREKTIDERLEVIEKLFYYEALKLNIPISISPEVVKALALYEFRDGNIGQLSSEIKLVCAKAFFQHLQNNEALNIEFKMLNEEIKGNLFNLTIPPDVKNFLSMFTENLIIHPFSSFDKNEILTSNIDDEEDLYDCINQKMEELRSKGLDSNEIERHINSELDNHFNTVINKFSSDNLNIRKLYNIIPKELVDSSASLIQLAQNRLNTKFNNKFFFGFTFHIYSLLKRLEENKPIKNPNLAIIRRQYKEEFKVASELVKMLSDKFSISIPEDEKGFLSILLANNKSGSNPTDNTIGIVMVCHGDSTATSMGNVANKLLNVEHIISVDMPLSAKIPETYEKVKLAVLNSNTGKGVLLLVDMGSLSGFGEKIMSETGIKVRTISNISTLIALDTLRSVLYQKSDIDTIYNSIINMTAPQTEGEQKKKAIITVCVTGQGAGLISKDIITKLLDEDHKKAVEIITINYFDMENNLKSLEEKYDIIACIGSLRPQSDIPYFPINKLLTKNFQQEFIKFIDTKLISSSDKTAAQDPLPKNAYEISRDMLYEYVKYVNPKIAIIVIKKFIEKLNLNNEENSEDNLVDLIVHMGCMLDRCVHGDFAKFENVEQFKLKNLEQFNTVRGAAAILEKEYDVSITDDEICYIIKVIHR